MRPPASALALAFPKTLRFTDYYAKRLRRCPEIFRNKTLSVLELLQAAPQRNIRWHYRKNRKLLKIIGRCVPSMAHSDWVRRKKNPENRGTASLNSLFTLAPPTSGGSGSAKRQSGLQPFVAFCSTTFQPTALLRKALIRVCKTSYT